MSGLLALSIAYAFSQFYRSFLSVLAPQLITELGASKADLSLASGMWFICFALMQFAVGIGLDRIGPRRTCAWFFGTAGAGGALLFATAQTPSMAILAMGFIGIGCAPVLMASLFIFARRYSPRRFATLTSWLVAFGTLGNVAGAAPLAWAAELLGWRGVMLILAGINLLVAGAILRWVQDPPLQKGHGSMLGGYLRLLKLRSLWTIIPLTLVGYASAAGIRGLWTGPYLAELFNADTQLIGRVTIWMALAMVVGTLLYGPLDRIFNTRKWVVFGGNSVVLAALLLFITMPSPTLGMATGLFICIGLFGSGYAVLLAHGKSCVPAELLGRGVTLLNFFSIFGVGLLQLVTGWVVQTNTDPLQPMLAYQAMFATFAVVLAIALAIYLCSRDQPPGPV